MMHASHFNEILLSKWSKNKCLTQLSLDEGLSGDYFIYTDATRVGGAYTYVGSPFWSVAGQLLNKALKQVLKRRDTGLWTSYET